MRGEETLSEIAERNRVSHSNPNEKKNKKTYGGLSPGVPRIKGPLFRYVSTAGRWFTWMRGSARK